MTTATTSLPSKEALRIFNTLFRYLVKEEGLTQESVALILEATIQKVVEMVEAEAVTVFAKRSDGIYFEKIYYAPSLHTPARGAPFFDELKKRLMGSRLEATAGIAYRVISSGQAHYCPDTTADPQWDSSIDRKTGFTTRSLITVPFIDRSSVIGAIQVLNKSRGRLFTQHDRDLLQEVAAYSSTLIHKYLDPSFTLDDRETARYIAQLSGHECFDPAEHAISEKVADTIGVDKYQDLLRLLILPIAVPRPDEVDVAMANPRDISVKDEFWLLTRCELGKVCVAAKSAIRREIEKIIRGRCAVGEVAEQLIEDLSAQPGARGELEVGENSSENDAPVIRLSTKIVQDAYSRRASDIHMEPCEEGFLIRYRVDGALEEYLRLPRPASKPVVARFKIMAEMDISKREIPQDGRIKFKKYDPQLDLDLRVSSCPMVFGEKMVIRLLDRTSGTLPLEKMGFSQFNLENYRKAIKAPYGMVLHVGPTGSGKTTTLYAALNEINSPDVNIMTAEDPVEYLLPGINQSQMNKRKGYTFADALRSYLRQDPDVILVGEIRDLETAEISIEAALTGHLLFSTLHTNDAAGTVTRFLDIGIEPVNIADTLLLVCAQRLLRRLCLKCRESCPAEEERLKSYHLAWEPGLTLYRHKGCEHCRQLGYKGRTGTHEVLIPEDTVKKLIVHRASSTEIKKAAIATGMIPIMQDAFEKAKAGVTSFEEVISEVRE